MEEVLGIKMVLHVSCCLAHKMKSVQLTTIKMFFLICFFVFYFFLTSADQGELIANFDIAMHTAPLEAKDSSLAFPSCKA